MNMFLKCISGRLYLIIWKNLHLCMYVRRLFNSTLRLLKCSLWIWMTHYLLHTRTHFIFSYTFSSFNSTQQPYPRKTWYKICNVNIICCSRYSFVFFFRNEKLCTVYTQGLWTYILTSMSILLLLCIILMTCNKKKISI